MDWWRSNAPRMKSDLTSLIISCTAPRAGAVHEKNRMSKAALVRGAFAIQCTLSVPPVISAVSRCSHACSHYQSPIVKYGTVERSDLAKCRQDDLCCRRTIRRWNPEARGFRLMYGTPAADEKNFIHAPVSPKSSVARFSLNQEQKFHQNHHSQVRRVLGGEDSERPNGHAAYVVHHVIRGVNAVARGV